MRVKKMYVQAQQYIQTSAADQKEKITIKTNKKQTSYSLKKFKNNDQTTPENI